MASVKNSNDAPPLTKPGSPKLIPIRCASCHARLFDGRPAVQECDLDEAEIVVKCWRCGKLSGFANSGG
jgi:hypothetical protein